MRNGFWLVLGALQMAAASAACDTAHAQLLINEVLAAPGRDWNADGVVSSRDDEWVEVYNPTGSSITLDGYRIADADTSWRMGLSGTLGPHGHLVVYGLDALNWEKATHHTASGLSLNNAGDTVRLWKFTGTDSAQVDVYTYGSNEGGADRATGRFPDGAPNWRIFDSLNPAPASSSPAGTGCPPSPNTANGCATAVKDTTWGGLRNLYRPGNEVKIPPGK